jgi:hypothetical protein
MMASTSERNVTPANSVRDTFLADVVVARLTALEAGQSAMNGALGLMLDTLQAQTHLLRKLNEYASEEPAASPVAKILSELTSAIVDLDASIGTMEKKFDRLEDNIAAAYRIEPDRGVPAAVNGKES